MKKRLIVLLPFLCLYVFRADAATIDAASCSQSDVQAAVDAASDGDIVMVPAGTCTWASGVSFANKGITLKGASVGQTTLITNAFPMVSITGEEGKPFRVTGIAFLNTGSGADDVMNIGGTCKDWRVDHCKFTDVGGAINISGYTYGLIDNCTFYVHKELSGPETMLMIGSDGLSVSDAWYRPLTLGTSNAVYIENCLFDFAYLSGGNTNVYHSYRGARVVFRHNRLNGKIEIFGSSNDGVRGTVSTEFYNNDIFGEGVKIVWTFFGFLGGTGVVFDNTVTNAVYSSNNIFLIWNYRTCMEQTINEFGNSRSRCDGRNFFDGNFAIASSVHTGNNNQSTLTSTGENWTTNQWVDYAVWNMTDYSVGKITANTSDTVTATLSEGYVVVDSGTHTGSDNASILVCEGKSWNYLVNRCYVYNVTDGSKGRITSSYTIGSTISGGIENDWDYGDVFLISRGYPPGIAENDWDTGDVFKITDGYPCIDQVGRSPETELVDGIPVQKSEPIYEWNNTWDESDLNFVYNGNCNDFPHSSDHIQEGRDWYQNTVKSGYTPYQYPHPLQFIDIVDTTPPINIATVNDGVGTDIDSTSLTTELSANWTPSTDGESGISTYRYAISLTPGGSDIVGWTSTNNGMITSVTESGLSLTVGVTYYFTVKAVNGVGLESLSATNSNGQYVTGGGDPGDEIPPVIANVNAGNITMTGATITWDTDEPATSQVEYGPSAASYGNSTSEDSNLATSHSANLTGLIPGIEYHYRVVSKDSSDNEKISIDYTFKTPGNEIDVKVYPSPYNSSKGSSMRFSIDGTVGGEVKIYTISGKLVKKLVIQSGVSEVNWDVLNEDGHSITTGLYIYSITDADGNRKTGKLAITK